MRVTLYKDDLISLVMGTGPNLEDISEFSRNEYGYWTGGFVDKWTWNDWKLKKMSQDELWKLYRKCREDK